MTVAVLHLVATVLMAGVIVYVQVVHYPLMARVGRELFPAYEAGHTVRTGWVVIPLMLTELATAAWLGIAGPEAADRSLAYLGLGLLAVVWISTAALQAPAHRRLSRGFHDGTHRKLVRTNWIRTAAWIARVPIAVEMAV